MSRFLIYDHLRFNEGDNCSGKWLVVLHACIIYQKTHNLFMNYHPCFIVKSVWVVEWLITCFDQVYSGDWFHHVNFQDFLFILVELIWTVKIINKILVIALSCPMIKLFNFLSILYKVLTTFKILVKIFKNFMLFYLIVLSNLSYSSFHFIVIIIIL